MIYDLHITNSWPILANITNAFYDKTKTLFGYYKVICFGPNNQNQNKKLNKLIHECLNSTCFYSIFTSIYFLVLL